MARSKILRMNGDVREHPRYSVEDAARYLHIPISTMRAWVSGYKRRNRTTGKVRRFDPLITPADPKKNLLSFYNLAEAHVLRSTRDRQVPLVNVRRAMEYIRQYMKSEYPLISNDFATSGQDMFVTHLGQTINASKAGQVAMHSILNEYLLRIERDASGMPTQFSPFHSVHLNINPRVSSGSPVIRGSGVMVSVVLARKESGESLPELARDFGLSTSDIEEAIREYAA